MDTPQQHKSELKPEDLSYDFDKIVSSPNGVELVNKILAGERRRMNTMTLAEFRKYEKLFQYDGQDILGPNQFKNLAIEYFHTICIYDPVTVMDGTTVAMVLPPIFNRYNPIGNAGQTGTDINQAFINACNSDDPMARARLEKYTEFYKRMISVVNSEELRQANEEKAHEQAKTVMDTVTPKRKETRASGEIEDIGSSNFKDSEVVSLFDNNSKSKQEDEDEFEPL